MTAWLWRKILKYPLAKVESLFHIRHEDGTVQFFDKPLDPRTFAGCHFDTEWNGTHAG